MFVLGVGYCNLRIFRRQGSAWMLFGWGFQQREFGGIGVARKMDEGSGEGLYVDGQETQPGGGSQQI